MYSYFAYGIHIHCDIELPGLLMSEGEADVVLKYGKAQPLEPVRQGVKWCFQFKDNDAYFFHHEWGSCRVNGGREIIGEVCNGKDTTQLALLAQGLGVSVILHQRGYVTLHASCVATSDGAIAFVGKSGSGKSVLAAALHSEGYGLISDDVTVIDPEATTTAVYPGYPQCYLMPDAAEYFGYEKDGFTEANFVGDKIACSLPERFPVQPIALRHVYLLDYGPKIKIEPVSSHRAVYELIRNSYWVHLIHDARPSSYFLQCTKICEKTGVYVLSRPRSMQMLPELLDLLKRNLSADTKSHRSERL
jgi:hypothetical protein